MIEDTRVDDRCTRTTVRANRHRDSEAALFASPPTDLLQLIKWRDLYSWLEETVDACKDASQVISEIVIKGS